MIWCPVAVKEQLSAVFDLKGAVAAEVEASHRAEVRPCVAWQL